MHGKITYVHCYQLLKIMAKCIRCGGEILRNDNRKICRECMGNWRKMRETNYAYCEKTIGKMAGEQFAPFQKEMKRLENIWRRNKEKWAQIVCE